MAAVKFLSHFVPDQLARTPAPCTRSFAGQTVIITGSNSGLGYEAARQILTLGVSKMILAVRSESKGAAAAASLAAASGCPSTAIEVWTLDLASYASVQAFAARCETLPRIDALIENAGILTSEHRVVEGNESQITVNVISTFMLLLLLLPKLRESAERHGTAPTAVIMSSALFEIAPLKERNAPHILNAMNENKKIGTERYNDSKLLEILYFQSLVSAMEEKGSRGGVVVNCAHPGFCTSELQREQRSASLKMGERLLARTAEEGARTEVYAASAGPESHGKWQSNGKSSNEIECTWVGKEEGRVVGRKVFKEVNEMLEAAVPAITKNI